jgi:N-acetyl-1-D-myo-inositol-2-amino-2-deoxy-alpha-D-glucopyranoside deacetylase
MTAPATSPSLHGHVLLGVFAHPDDESLACGGLLARCAALGAAVTLLCLTRGEGGPGLDTAEDGENGGTETRRRRLAALRTQELDAASRVLGVSDLVVLDHADGMLPWIEAEALDADIRAALERLRPDVVITFGPDGLYWHPDHIAVHERTTAVVAAAGDAAPALYYVTMPPGQMRAVAEQARAGGAVVPGLDNPDAFGALAEPPTLVIEAGGYAARKLAALECHHSQFGASPIARISDGDAARLLGTEHYRRAAVGRVGVTFLDQLGSPAPDPLAPSAE